MKKLIIQIPCYNEAENLGQTMAGLPRTIEGIDSIEFLVIDDGSTDSTSEVARKSGAHHVICLPSNRGLARAFAAGLEACLEKNADLIVNTDADNQYVSDDIARLVAPILQGEAEIVIGARPIQAIEHFSVSKRILQALGSRVVRWVSGTRVPDATSGFRAMSREAALRLNVFSSYTYTLETIIQAGHSGIALASVPVNVNPPTRDSRLIKSVPGYIWRSLWTIVRIFALYKPLRFFIGVGLVPFSAGFLLGLRFLYYYWAGQGSGMVQSLVLAAVLLLIGFQLGVLGFLADLIATNRRILEEIQTSARRMDSGRK